MPPKQRSKRLTKSWQSSGTPTKTPTTKNRQSRSFEKSLKLTKTCQMPIKGKLMTPMVSMDRKPICSEATTSAMPTISLLTFSRAIPSKRERMTFSVPSLAREIAIMQAIVQEIEGLGDLEVLEEGFQCLATIIYLEKWADRASEVEWEVVFRSQ